MAWSLSLPEVLALLLATEHMEEVSDQQLLGFKSILAHACPQLLFLRVSYGDI